MPGKGLFQGWAKITFLEGKGALKKGFFESFYPQL